MNPIDHSSLTSDFANIDPWRTAALIAGIIAAQVALYLILGRATRAARARARESARAWAATQREVWRARTAARAARAHERETDAARAERAARRAALARAGLVALVALAATNLSAHGIQAGLPGVGLGDLNTRVSAFVVFEGLLALSAALSWWHQTTNQPGYDRYRAAMWAITAVMSYLGWAWSGEVVFALWPPLAAVAWHWVVTAEARRRHGGLGVLARLAEAARRRWRPATSADGAGIDRERRLSTIVRRAVRANTAPRATRAWWARAYTRALDAAEVRGYLDDGARAELAERAAARYAGPAALAPEAVADRNPWTRLAAPEPAPAPVEDAPADVPEARADLRVVAPAPADVPIGGAVDIERLIADHYAGPERSAAWVAEYWRTHGSWPTGRVLGVAFGAHEGTARKWIGPLRRAAAQYAAA